MLQLVQSELLSCEAGEAAALTLEVSAGRTSIQSAVMDALQVRDQAKFGVGPIGTEAAGKAALAVHRIDMVLQGHHTGELLATDLAQDAAGGLAVNAQKGHGADIKRQYASGMTDTH